MPYGDCRDKIRFALSDESGELRFTSFDIVDMPECQDLARALQEYLLDRPLAEVDLDYLVGLRCRANGECVQGMIRMVDEYQAMFALGRG